MSQLSEHTSEWWPEERIKATLNAKYIVNRLHSENVPRLFELPDWGEGLTSETYMEWILLKAARLFLILDTIGIPDRIFALINDSCGDSDLPVAEDNVNQLCLSPGGKDANLDTRFFHAQWRFLVRGITEGDHIVYSEDESVPVELLKSNTGGYIHGRDETFNKVVLAGSECRAYMRKQVQINSAPDFFSANEILVEIQKLRELSHKHVMSVYASYLHQNIICILFTGANAQRTLHSFLTDEPGSFKRLAKEKRRQIMVNWPHCLVSAVSWLHARGQVHGAIRPSNIFIDPDFHIRLGQFQALRYLLVPPHIDDLETYNYSAPECHTQTTAPVMPQRPQPVQTIQASGGRTKRRQKPARLALASLNENSSPSMHDHAKPESTSPKGKVIRIGLPGSPSRLSIAFSSSSSSTASTASGFPSPHPNPDAKKHRISAFWSYRKPPSLTSSASSYTSSSSSMPPSPSSLSPQTPLSPNKSSLRHSKSAHSLASSASKPLSQSISNPATDLHPQSTRTNPPDSPADLFSLAAVTLDILTSLHKRTQQSFIAHRSARNRSAGRGGGIADASFHLPRNAVQVHSWIALLEGDALKRCRRDRRSDAVFWAVPRMLIAVRAMLHSEARKRPLARRVGRCFAVAVEGAGGKPGLVLHCAQGEVSGVKKVSARKELVEAVKKTGGSSGFIASSGISSDSVSELEFGLDTSGGESQDETPEEIEMEELGEAKYDPEPKILLQQDSPQLYLPELDVTLKEVDKLRFTESDIS